MHGVIFSISQFKSRTRVIEVRTLRHAVVLVQSFHQTRLQHFAGQNVLKPADAVCQMGRIGNLAIIDFQLVALLIVMHHQRIALDTPSAGQ